MGGARGVTGDGSRGRRGTMRPLVGAVGAVLVVANVLLALGAVVGIPPIGLSGVVPVLVIDVVAVVVVVVLAGRGGPPTAGTLQPRRYPGPARVAAGLTVVAGAAAVADDSAWALLAAPAGFFALVMALFRTTAVWWRWCARAAAVSVLTWPAPVLAGMRLDRDAIEGYGVGFGSLVTMGLVGLTVTLATVAAVGYAVDAPARPTTAAPDAAAEPG